MTSSVLPGYRGSQVSAEQTIHYKTYTKTALVEALRRVFANHPDSRIATTSDSQGVITGGTKITIEYPTSEAAYPTIIVRFYERQVRNAGVGHIEYILNSQNFADTYRHYLYDGTIEFAIQALSSLDRDLISDSLVQTLTMGDLLPYTQSFRDRIYYPNDPFAASNFININTDTIQGFGETQTPQPWLTENELVYQTSYRVGIYGEFYSLPPALQGAPGLVEHVKLFPYIEGIDPLPTGASDPSVWQ